MTIVEQAVEHIVRRLAAAMGYEIRGDQVCVIGSNTDCQPIHQWLEATLAAAAEASRQKEIQAEVDKIPHSENRKILRYAAAQANYNSCWAASARILRNYYSNGAVSTEEMLFSNYPNYQAMFYRDGGLDTRFIADWFQRCNGFHVKEVIDLNTVGGLSRELSNGPVIIPVLWNTLYDSKPSNGTNPYRSRFGSEKPIYHWVVVYDLSYRDGTCYVHLINTLPMVEETAVYDESFPDDAIVIQYDVYRRGDYFDPELLWMEIEFSKFVWMLCMFSEFYTNRIPVVSG